jgi:hypothetical protein
MTLFLLIFPFRIFLSLIKGENREIVSSWEQLGVAGCSWAQLVEKLEESFYRFPVDYRDLTSWISDVKIVIAADHLAKVPYFFIKVMVSREQYLF